MKPRTVTTTALLTSAALMATLIPSLLAQQQKPPPEDKFQTAQRHIYSAIGDLQDYIHANPTGKDVTTATLQLKNLQALNTYASQARFVTLSYFEDPLTTWRIIAVDRKSDLTRITFEIKNLSDKATNWFLAFDKCPLVLVDNLGQYYPAGDVGPLPEGVITGSSNWNEASWLLHGGQTVTMTVDFPPLQPAATGGRVMYKDAHTLVYDPATFSLLNKKQVAGG